MTLSLSSSQVRKKHLPSGSTKSTVPRIAMHGTKESNRGEGREGREGRGRGGEGGGGHSHHDTKMSSRLTILLHCNIL